ncbi:MAG: RNA polymerase sigma factor [Solirubrobacteraceae bacterium]
MSGTTRSKLRSPRRLSDGEITTLVLAAGAGDKASWDALVDQFSGLIWATVRAYRLGDADGADVVQVTWLRLVERLDRLHNPARVGCWLATTARHESLRILNANKREVPMGDDVGEQESLAPPPGESLLQTERDEAIRRVFSLLPAKDQALLRLLTAEPRLPYSEIAAALGIPIGSVGPTRQRALDRLRRLLESRGVMTQLAECGGRR